VDDIDRAQEREQLDRALALAALQRRLDHEPRSGATHCVDCGEQIDPRRRAAVPCAQRCADCQKTWEVYGG